MRGFRVRPLLFAAGAVAFAWILPACSPAEGEAQDAAPGSAQTPRNIRIVELRRTDLQEHVALSGRVRAVHSTDVSTEEAGVVESLPHDRGSLVESGGVIVALDRDLLAAEMQAAQSSMKLREYTSGRMKTLYEQNSASREDALIAQTEFEQAVSRYEIARLRHDRAEIKAPFRGIVAERFVEIGQHVVPGQIVARVVDPFVLALEGWVTERDVEWIREGAPALIVFDGQSDLVPAVVHWVGVEADPRNGKFAVELRIANSELKQRAGVVASARVEKRSHRNALVIPRDSIIDSGNGPMVFVEADGKAEGRPVELGPDEGLMVVCESGLREGDRLIVRGQRDLAPGAPVLVQERSERRDGWLPSDSEEAREADLTSPREHAGHAKALGERP